LNFLGLIILAITSGCGLFHKDTEKTATELLTEARAEYQDKDYRDAVELFQQLINWYPFSEHVAEAEIKIADAYYEMEKYNEAIRAYNSFERLHPLHPEPSQRSLVAWIQSSNLLRSSIKRGTLASNFESSGGSREGPSLLGKF
jgi:outer membrane assembly lipoprotein YfiO